MGDNNDKESSIVRTVSKQVGAVAGTSVVISKKLAGRGIKTLTTTKDRLKRPLKALAPTRVKKGRTTSLISALESKGEQETGRKKAAKALIATLESDLAAAQCKLEKVQSNAEKTQSKLASQLGELKAEKESLVSDLKKSRKDKKIPKPKPLPDRAEMASPAAVMDEESQASVFPNATDKIILTRALSDIENEDAAVRADAAKTMACVRHELSVKTLVAQLACESSVQVRQECIKALVTLEMTEALPAVERALTDEAGSVRLAAVWGLYHLAGTEGAPTLIRMFADEDEEVRRRAATCIGWLGQKELAVKLLPLLDDNSVSVRRAAAEAMGNLRSRQVVSSLIEQLNDPVESVRKVVFSALEKITSKKMSKSFPKDEKGFERLIARWQEWRKEEFSG
jgi:HEAT repeat protein